jgi:hypothetical protein
MDTIDVDKIDLTNKTYCVSYPLDDEFLLSSLSQFGFLSPIGLSSLENPIIVCGHKRVHAAKKLGISRIPYYIIDITEKKTLFTAILDNSSRVLNTVEKALCIERMVSFGFLESEIEAIQKLVGLPVRKKTTENAIALIASDVFFKSFVVRYGIPLTIVEHFLWFEEEDRSRITYLLDPLHPSTSFLRDVVRLLMLLKVKKSVIDFEYLSAAADMESLRRRIKLLTHPTLSDMEGSLENILKEAALPPQIRLSVDPAFERDWIEISLKVRNITDINEGIGKIEQIQSQGHLRRILDLTHGSSDRT